MRGFRFRSSLKKVTRAKRFLAASTLVSSALAEDEAPRSTREKTFGTQGTGTVERG